MPPNEKNGNPRRPNAAQMERTCFQSGSLSMIIIEAILFLLGGPNANCCQALCPLQRRVRNFERGQFGREGGCGFRNVCNAAISHNLWHDIISFKAFCNSSQHGIYNAPLRNIKRELFAQRKTRLWIPFNPVPMKNNDGNNNKGEYQAPHFCAGHAINWLLQYHHRSSGPKLASSGLQIPSPK